MGASQCSVRDDGVDLRPGLPTIFRFEQDAAARIKINRPADLARHEVERAWHALREVGAGWHRYPMLSAVAGGQKG